MYKDDALDLLAAIVRNYTRYMEIPFDERDNQEHSETTKEWERTRERYYRAVMRED